MDSHRAVVSRRLLRNEIGAGSYAGKRSAYLRGFIGEIIQLPRVPIQHIVDNSATPALTENNGVSKKTEHFRRWMHYLRYLVTHGFTYVHLWAAVPGFLDKRVVGGGLGAWVGGVNT